LPFVTEFYIIFNVNFSYTEKVILISKLVQLNNMLILHILV